MLCSHVLQSKVFDAKIPLALGFTTYLCLEEIHLARQQAVLFPGLLFSALCNPQQGCSDLEQRIFSGTVVLEL